MDEGTKLLAALLAMAATVAGWMFLYTMITASVARSQLEGRVARLGMSVEEWRRRRRSVLLQAGEAFDRTPWARRVERWLEQADLQITPSEYVLILCGLVLLIFLTVAAVFRLPPFLNLVVAVVSVALISKFYLDARKDHYLTTLSSQMPEVATLISNSLKAGLSVNQSFEEVAEKVPRPAGTEFARLSREIRFGAPVDEALRHMMDHLPCEELHLMLTTILIQRRAGGNLTRALAVMSAAVLARHRLRNEINTMTAEVRFTGIALVALPVVILAIINQAMKDSVTLFLSSPIGMVITAIFVVVQIGAFFIIRRVANVEV